MSFLVSTLCLVAFMAATVVDAQPAVVHNHAHTPGTVAGGQTGVPYNKLRQKSSHNAYEWKEALQDQLQYHRVHSLELDLWRAKDGHPTRSQDWFVYHHWTLTATTCHRLSDCLKEFKAWSDANPNHEPVTIWMDMKDDHMHSWSGHGPSDLDARIAASGLDLYRPINMRGSATTLQGGVANGWPTNVDLRGKFIFILTDNSEHYCDSDTTCGSPSRQIFRHCSVHNWSEIDDDGFCVFFNQECGDDITIDIYNAGYVSRCYKANSAFDWWFAEQHKVHHIATDKINFHEDPWTITHNANGWPFERIDGFSVGSFQSGGNVIGMTVDSGDIWSKYDDFAFAYHPVYSTGWTTYTVAVNNANDNVDDWAKGGLMVRDNISSKNRGESSKYFAVLRGADNKKLRVQYRSSYKGNTSEKTVDIAPFGDSIDQESRCFLKLRVYYSSSNNRSTVYGYGSQDGVSWKYIYGRTFSNSNMKFQGLAASSHGDSGNADGSRVKHLFTNYERDGVPVDQNFLTLLNVGNDVPHRDVFHGFFP